MIQVLSEDLRCRLRSGVAITSVAQCVEELLLNSADAQATCIAVRVDLETFKVQVVDNGCGLCREDMESIGMRYCTSKCHSLKDLENLSFHGLRGEAIASMVDVSSVVEICSRQKETGQTFSRIFRNGKPLGSVKAESPRPSAGTTVTLYNLFSTMPVRRKHLEPALELERIRQRVEAVSLLKPDVSFSLRNDAVYSVLLHLPKTKDLLSRFCQIYGLGRSQSLREVRHSHGAFTIHGLLSCEAHYNKAMQFLYVNKRLVLKTKLHKLIDFIVRRESSICRGRGVRHRSAADLYSVFVLNIQCQMSEYDVCFQPDKTLIEFQDWDLVMRCMEQGLRSFLKKENLFSELSKEDVAEFSQKHHYNLTCHVGEEPLVAPQDPETSLTSDITYLRSRCVHRSRNTTEMGSPPPVLAAQHESEQVPSNIPENHIGPSDSAPMDDTQDSAETHNRSPLLPPDTSTIQEAAEVSTTLTGPQNSADPRSPGSDLIRAGTSEWIPPNSEKPRSGLDPVHTQHANMGGTLDRFRRHFGKSHRVEPQLPPSPWKARVVSLKHCASTEAPAVIRHRSTARKLSKIRKSQDPECTPTLTTKLCMLKNMEEAGRGSSCNLHLGPPTTSTAWKKSSEQQATPQQNGQTWLSSYSAPTWDKRAACTQDLSNIAVNVVCRSGFQYQCHPFKTQALLPFLPRPRAERDPAELRDNGGLSTMYTEWKNPVYVRQPSLAVDVSRDHCDSLSVKIHNILYPYRFTKEMVHSIKVLQQVDSKFIACLMTSEVEVTAAPGSSPTAGGHLLVLVDQHAAHERVRLEQLIADSVEVSDSGERRLKVSLVDPALEMTLSEEDYRVLRTLGGTLRRVGLSVSFPDPGGPRVLVSEIPLCFLEREVNETQRGRSAVIRSLVEECLKEQVQLLQVPGAGHGVVPGTVLKVLASQACHGAVKFNHPLTVEECRHLMHSLAQCSLPFQCAHGRPSILPLADLQHIAPEPEVSPKPNLKCLRRWQ
ncbi:DNA mismatch repair protein Mlh3 isoform X2 [Hyla sarda]|uniref:DNA mismatch repair protein Mlh3 isoform X2 n=1 Tax=Hyla sarda TaxID=327740 RepID=UPI0024C25848|nr:DNA mismatch repair protein Mlh3 isoform X2 [Hyla sarda]